MSDDELRAALEDVEARLAWARAQLEPRRRLEAEARALLTTLSRRRRLAQQRGVRTWERAARGALRMTLLAVGCVALGTGAWALDPALGGVSLVASMLVLGLEALR